MKQPDVTMNVWTGKQPDVTMTVFSVGSVLQVVLAFSETHDIDVIHDPPTHAMSSGVSLASAPRDRWNISMFRRQPEEEDDA